MQCTGKRERGVVAVVGGKQEYSNGSGDSRRRETETAGGQSVQLVSSDRQTAQHARTPPSLDDRAGVFGPLNQQQQQKQRRLLSHARPLLN